MRGCDIPVEAVAVLQEQYPGFDKPLWSKCRHPEKYGIRLTSNADKMLAEKGVKIPRKRADKRSKEKSKRITFRASEEIFEALQCKAESTAEGTMQELMERAVKAYLEEKK